MSDHPTVRLSALVPDNCNFKDRTFESYVSRWMNRMMPGVPMGLLDTESDIAHERWQIQPNMVHVVKPVTVKVWKCAECGELYTERPEEFCCEFACEDECGMQHSPDCDGNCDHIMHHNMCLPDEKSDLERLAQVEAAFELAEERVFILLNEHVSEAVSMQDYIRHADLKEDRSDVTYDGEGVLGWEDEGDAEEAATQADGYFDSEHYRHGFPWANSYAYMPDRYITDGSLKAAGFVVARSRPLVRVRRKNCD